MVECRICLDIDILKNVISPCRCTGTTKWVHEECLQIWRAKNISNSKYTHCEICLTDYMVGRNDSLETHIIQIISFPLIFKITGYTIFMGIGGVFLYIIDGYSNYISLKIFNIDDKSLHMSEYISKNGWVCLVYYHGMCGFIFNIIFFTCFYISIFLNIKNKGRYFKLVFFKNLIYLLMISLMK